MFTSRIPAGCGFSTQSFLSAVTPQLQNHPGTLAIGTLAPGAVFVSERHITPHSDVNLPDADMLQGHNVWFTPATFTADPNPGPNATPGRHKRKQAAVYAVQSFWADLDVGDSAGKYASKDEALVALQTFANANSWMPHLVVDSGRGIQAYWLLDTPLTRDQWLDLALRLRVVMDSQGLRYDPSRAADSCSWLRLPGFQNPKPGAGVAHVLWAGQHPRHSVQELTQRLANVDTRADLSSLLAKINKSEPAWMAVARASGFKTTWDLSDLQQSWEDFASGANGGNCPRIIWAMQPENQAKIEEPEWYHMLGFFRQFHRGIELAHMASCHHPDYDPDTTERKFRQWSAGAPTRSGYRSKMTQIPGAPTCDACPLAPSCRTPAQWGNRVDKVIPIHPAAQPQPVASQAPQTAPWDAPGTAPQATATPAPAAAPEVPVMPAAADGTLDTFRFNQGAEPFGTYSRESYVTESGEERQVWLRILNARLRFGGIITGQFRTATGQTVEETSMRLIVENRAGVSTDVRIPVAQLVADSNQEIFSRLASVNVSIPATGVSWSTAVMKKWKETVTRLLRAHYTIGTKDDDSIRAALPRMGWTDANEDESSVAEFTLGKFAYSTTGVRPVELESKAERVSAGIPLPSDESPAAIVQETAAMLRAAIPRGDAGLPDLALIAASLGTALQRVCVPAIERGGVVVAHSKDSGTGKTSALTRAMSMWTKAPGTLITQSATRFGFFEMLLQPAHSIPVVWDDAFVGTTDDNGKVFGEFVMASTGRSSRVRATDTKSKPFTWDTYVMMSMNPDPFELLTQVNSSADGALKRILSIPFHKGRLSHGDRDGATAFAEWATRRGGLFGQVFLRAILDPNNQKFAKDVYNRERRLLADAIGADNAADYRFIISISATMLTAATIVNVMGANLYDVDKLRAYLLNAMYEQRDAVAEVVSSPMTDAAYVLINLKPYLIQVSSNGLVSDSPLSRGQAVIGSVTHETDGSTTYRIMRGTKIDHRIISASQLRALIATVGAVMDTDSSSGIASEVYRFNIKAQPCQLTPPPTSPQYLMHGMPQSAQGAAVH